MSTWFVAITKTCWADLMHELAFNEPSEVKIHGPTFSSNAADAVFAARLEKSSLPLISEQLLSAID